MSLCEENKEKKNEHLIANIKGVILFKKQNYEQAKAEFLNSIVLDQKFLDPHKNLYKLHIKLEDFKSAIENAKKVIQLELKKNPLSYFNLALAYDFNNDYKKAIELDHLYFDPLFNMGILNEEKGDFTLAINCYEKVIQINPNNVDVYYNLGNILRDLGKVEEAKFCSKKIMSISSFSIVGSYSFNYHLKSN